ncbi:MAG: NADH-quinone oxidoreductase subunit G [Betaproteobacteria bacterium]|nr:NADH-quinone oxidoreductase subunit G [Betaproteobacteria bacterium]
MLEIEIDGKALEVEDGTTVLNAALGAGIYIPHFCYHRKLSIAANCRMCLVQVEKAPKPMPACATPASKGMKVFTRSEAALKAQKGVMEFLLINHPLDCPICDQGGECQLQDLAVGYGASSARYQEEKRVVVNKYLGPLVATDMTRCIHCTRCVRFTQEIAGVMELGQAFRGEHAEIMPFIEQTVDSELSGNIIDLCPVGALTSKPFRFAARTWELARRRSVSPHDSLGSNLIVQVKQDRVLRVLPLDNEELNECWLSDKDRFSYEALGSADRLVKPMVKQNGQWQEVEWPFALEHAAHSLQVVVREYGAGALAALVSPHATLEEMYLAGRLVRGLGGDNIDFRLRHSDFSRDAERRGAPWLGLKVAEISGLDRVLVVGAFLRKDQPLIAQRLRKAARCGAQVSVIHCCEDDALIKLHGKAIAAPSQLPAVLAQVVKAVAQHKGASCDLAVEISDEARKIADSLVSGQDAGKTAILLGNFSQQHPAASTLHALASQLAELLGARCGFLGEAANSVGGYVAGALPAGDGMNAARMIADPRRAYLLLGLDPELDCADGRGTVAALEEAHTVVALSAFKSPRMLEFADVLLPISPFSETSGSFVNCEGRVQSFNAVVRPAGESRPGWKVLRVLGNLLSLSGFDHDSSEAVRAECLGGQPEFASGLDNSAPGTPVQLGAGEDLERIAEVPIHFADPLVRRAPGLQATRDAAAPTARMNAATLDRFAVAAGERVRVRQGEGEAVVQAVLDPGVPDGCVRVAAGHPSTAGLGPLFGSVTVERI